MTPIRSSVSNKNPSGNLGRTSADFRKSASLEEEFKRQNIINILFSKEADKNIKDNSWLWHIPKRIENACQRMKGNRIHKQDVGKMYHNVESSSMNSMRASEFPVEDMMLLVQGMDKEDCPVEGLKVHKGSICLYNDTEPFSSELPAQIRPFHKLLTKHQNQNLPPVSNNTLWTAIN